MVLNRSSIARFGAPTVGKAICPSAVWNRLGTKSDYPVADLRPGQPTQKAFLRLPLPPKSQHPIGSGKTQQNWSPASLPPSYGADTPGVWRQRCVADATRLQASRGLIAHKIKPSNTKMLF